MALATGACATFLTKSSGPRLLALEPAKFARWVSLPQRVAERDARAILSLADDKPALDPLGPRGADGLIDLGKSSDLVVQACVVDAGLEHLPPDWGSGDLSHALERRRPAGADDDAFELLLSLVSNSKAGKPWWFTARFHGCCNYGLLPPESTRALCEASRAIQDDAFALPELFEFLRELSGAGPRWLACTEW